MPGQQEALQIARARIGFTPTRRIEWLLEFAKLDLSQITDQNLLSLQQQILMFLDQEEDILRNRLPQRHQILGWQGQTQEGLKKISKGKSWGVEIAGRLIAERRGVRIVNSSTRHAARQDHWPFTFHSINTLIQGANLLRYCANAKCSQLYLRNKRQNYCSIRCRDAVNKRLYRKRIQQDQA